MIDVMKKYEHIAIGGTFDHLHKGHLLIFDKAMELGSNITIGLATEKIYFTKPLANLIQSYQIRKKAIEKHFESKSYNGIVSFTKLEDIYGPSIVDASFDAIIVTDETCDNAVKINKKRQENKLKPLTIIKVRLVKGDYSKIIRSERIRMGQMDREGKSYLKLFTKKERLLLPNFLRVELKKPLGQVFKRVEFLSRVRPLTENAVVIISVGDVITKALLRANIIPSIQIIDHRKQRRQIPARNRLTELPYLIKAKNRAGTLSRFAVLALSKAINLYFTKKQPQQVVIEGEEDLLALPSILLSPLGGVVLYGQPKQAVVAITVDEIIKKRTRLIIEKFDYKKTSD